MAYGIDPVYPVNPVKFSFGCGLAAALGSSAANSFPPVNGYAISNAAIRLCLEPSVFPNSAFRI